MKNPLIGIILDGLNKEYNSGACDGVSAEDLEVIIDTLSALHDRLSNKEEKTVNKTLAEDFVHLGRAQFDNYRRAGIAPLGFHERGGALRFKISELKEFKQRLKELKNGNKKGS